MILEKSFCEMIFGSVDIVPVYGFLKTNFLMITKMKDCVTLDSDDDDAEFWYGYRDVKTAQIKEEIKAISAFNILIFFYSLQL